HASSCSFPLLFSLLELCLLSPHACPYLTLLLVSLLLPSTGAAPTVISALSLHDALPISCWHQCRPEAREPSIHRRVSVQLLAERSEEHTSELQSRFDLVCRLLLEKKKTSTWRGEYNQHFCCNFAGASMRGRRRHTN